MRFQINQDTGSFIKGWVIPDNPSVTPRVHVYFDNELRATVEATERRARLKEKGVHKTGIVGFLVSEKNCRGISKARGVKIYDADTNILLYQRRPGEQVIEGKLLRIETQMLRAIPLNEVLFRRFQMSYSGIEQFTEETLTSILGIQFAESIYLTGLVQLPSIEEQLRGLGYKIAVLLRDPYEELAERLLILRWAATPQGSNSSEHLGKGMAHAISVLRDSDLGSPEAISLLFDGLDDKVRRVLFNTLTRQLSCRSADEPLDDAAAATALDRLSEVDIVGVRRDVDAFLETIQAVFVSDDPFEPVKLESYPSVQRLTALLREIETVPRLIGLDLEVYSSVLAAMDSIDSDAVPVPASDERRAGARR
jgi:hypothetical protein